ncbi:hypothetical protein PBI_KEZIACHARLES14_3 [Mycobacterium phage Keziacharles14]|nr:hypothetical protein PBI_KEZIACHARLES14_3 [Mycobacterium phage Keziacharles14]
MEVPLDDLVYDPDGPPCAPYPDSVLILGGYRWLGMNGRLLTITADFTEWAASRAAQAVEDDEDPQAGVGSIYGTAVNLTNRTLAYWEAAAIRGGYVLSELLV